LQNKKIKRLIQIQDKEAHGKEILLEMEQLLKKKKK